MSADSKDSGEGGKSPSKAGSGAGQEARERADALTRKTTAPDSKDSKEKSGRPVLTEKQRIEARRARQARRRRKPVEGNPLSKGLRATGFEIRRTASFIGRSIIAALAALGPVFSALGMGLVWLLDQAGKGLKALDRIFRRGLALLGRALVALDRVVTPHRALILVAGVAAVLLGVSQFKGLGLIEIGQPGYSGIEDLARAPAIDRTTPAGVHTRILVPIAAVALAAVVVIALAGVDSLSRRFSRFRRLAAMILVTIGLLTLVVALLIDLPDATDTTEAALAYSGVKARLLSGFWLQLAAAATLTVAGFSLLFEPAPEKVRSRAPRRSEAAGSLDGRRAVGGGSA